MQFSDCVAPVT